MARRHRHQSVVDSKLDRSLGFGREENPNASFARLAGNAWPAEQDGRIPGITDCGHHRLDVSLHLRQSKLPILCFERGRERSVGQEEGL